MRASLAASCALLAVTTWAASATAEPRGNHTAELVAGVVFPMGEEDYEDFIDPSFKFGGRLAFSMASLSSGARLGLEVGLDWTPAANDLDDTAWVDASFHRIRVLAGARFSRDVGEKASIFFRAAGGLDYVTGSVEEELLGTRWEEDDIGLALELGGGAVARLGDIRIGAQLALPIAFHAEDDPDTIDYYDYTAYDLDFLFTFGTAF